MSIQQSTVARRRGLLAWLATINVMLIDYAHAQDGRNRGPFGLVWGMGVGQLDVGSVRAGNARDGDIRSASSMMDGWRERVPHDTQYIRLFFGHRDRLYRAHAKSFPYQPDPVTGRYRELSTRLAEIYGAGNETVAPRRWFGRIEPETALRETIFRTAELEVVLSLLYGFQGDLYWTILYTHRAGFAEFQADYRERTRDQL